MVFKAIRFVAWAHAGHYRKGTNIPYIYHLTNVMKILCEHGCREELIVAGLLHDAVEDTYTTLDDIKEQFGERVAQLVALATEPEKIDKSQPEAPWRARKEGTLQALQHTSNPDKLILSCADKLDNIRAIAEDSQKLGEAFWARFNAGKEEQHWYYQSMAQIFTQRAQTFGEPLKSLSQAFAQEVEKVFGAVQ